MIWFTFEKYLFRIYLALLPYLCCCSADQVAIIPDAVRALYQGLGVEPFSKCLEVTPVTELYAPCPKLQKYVHDVIGYVQRLLVADYDEVYAKLEASDIGSKLVSMTFGQVSYGFEVLDLEYISLC